MAGWLPALMAILLLATGPATAQSGEAESLYRRAWMQLEVERDPAGARALLAPLARRADLPPALAARVALGLARCDLLQGRIAQAEARLRRVREETTGLPHYRAEAEHLLAGLLAGRSRWTTALVTLHQSRYLDLDTGAVLSAPASLAGLKAELGAAGRQLVHLVAPVRDERMAGALNRLSDNPWHRLTTDQGRAAWVQLLAVHPRANMVTCRTVVRLSGVGEAIPPAVRGGRCRGEKGTITVRFNPADRYVAYRVDRRRGPRGAYGAFRTTTRARLVDREVEAGVRYGYRIVGVDDRGNESLPAFVQGTTASRGVVRGSITVAAEQSAAGVGFDLVADLAITDSRLFDRCDLVDVGELQDWRRMSLGLAPVNGAGRAGRTYWESLQASPGADRGEDPRAGAIFLVPLRGGGIAGCRFAWDRGRRERTLHYLFDPDRDAFTQAVAARLPGGEEESRPPGSGRENGPGSAAGPARPPAKEGVPEAADQAILFDWKRHGSYAKATFSFLHGLRDDPGLERTRNRWDLLFENNRLACLAPASTLSDLGRVDWQVLDETAARPGNYARGIEAKAQHMYLLHTLGPGRDDYALFWVAELVAGDRCRFLWMTEVDGVLRGNITMRPDQGQRLQALFRALRAGGGRRLSDGQGKAASRSRAVLQETDIPLDRSVHLAPRKLLTLLRRKTDLTVVEPDAVRKRRPLRRGKRPPRVVNRDLGPTIRPCHLLETLTRELGLTWTVAADGRVVLGLPEAGPRHDPRAQEYLVDPRTSRDASTSLYDFRSGRRRTVPHPDPISQRLPAQVEKRIGPADLQILDGLQPAGPKAECLSYFLPLGRCSWPEVPDRVRSRSGYAARVPVRQGEFCLFRSHLEDRDFYVVLKVLAADPERWCQIQWIGMVDGRLRSSPDVTLTPALRRVYSRLFRRLADTGNYGVFGVKAVAGWHGLWGRSLVRPKETPTLDRFLAWVAEGIGAKVILRPAGPGRRLSGRTRISGLPENPTAWQALEIAARGLGVRWWVRDDGTVELGHPYVEEEPGRPERGVTLLSRSRHQDYEKATFCFKLGVRERSQRSNQGMTYDTDLLYGNGGDELLVRTVTDDLSTITDLGPLKWEDLDGDRTDWFEYHERLPARRNHIYLVHVLDGNADMYALLRVVDLQPGDRCTIQWATWVRGRLTLSHPALRRPAAANRIRRLLRRVASQGGARWFPRSGRSAVSWTRLAAQVPDPPDRSGRLVEVVRGGKLRVLVDARITRRWHRAVVGPVTPGLTWWQLLERECRRNGFRWRIDEFGTLRIEP